MEGNRIVVQFGRPIEADVGPAVRALRKYLRAGQIGADGRSVTFTTVGDFGINDFDLGNAVVVDIVENEPTAAEPVQETKPETEKNRRRPKTTGGNTGSCSCFGTGCRAETRRAQW